MKFFNRNFSLFIVPLFAFFTNAAALAAVAEQPQRVLIPWGEGTENVQVYGVSDVSQSALYRTKDVSFEEYFKLPKESPIRAFINEDGTYLTFSVGGYLPMERDEDVERIPGAIHGRFWILIDHVSLEVTPEFSDYLTELVEIDPDLKIFLEDRRGVSPKNVPGLAKDYTGNELNTPLTILYREAASQTKHLKVSLSTEKKGLFKREDLLDRTVFTKKLDNLVHDQKEHEVELRLPAAKRLDLGRGGLPFYEALKLLDEQLVPDLTDAGELNALSRFPENAWRRQLLEKSLPIYFADELRQSDQVCQGYDLVPVETLLPTSLQLEMIELEPRSIAIPQTVTEVRDFD